MSLLQRARLLDIYAESAYYNGDAAAAESPYREQYELLQRLAKQHPQDVRVSRRLQRSGWALGTTLLELNRPSEGEPILAHAVSIAQQLQLLEPDDRDVARNVGIALSAHAQALVALGRYAEALPALDRSLRDRRIQSEQKPTDWGAARDHAIASATLADALADAGDERRACAVYDSTLDIFAGIRKAGRLAKLDEDYSLRLVHERMRKHCRD
jgi:tetratricopeptide (TPR) repeat protein